jgi:addiction module HigA family antidote
LTTNNGQALRGETANAAKEPCHHPPGKILLEEFMKPHGLSANALASALKVPANRVSAIVNGTRSVTADTALRLARYLGTTPDL